MTHPQNATEEAARTGADVEVPTEQPPVEPHTTRTISDVDNEKSKDRAPLTTDPEAQVEESVINPENS